MMPRTRPVGGETDRTAVGFATYRAGSAGMRGER